MSDRVKLLIAFLVGVIADRYLLNRLLAIISGILHPSSKPASA